MKIYDYEELYVYGTLDSKLSRHEATGTKYINIHP
jgi:hypothetical protein